jgi:hypothetical protein
MKSELFHPNERDLIKIINQFRKKTHGLIEAGTVSEDHKKILDSCNTLIQHLEGHAQARADVLARYDSFKNSIKDNAKCPKCGKVDQLKLKTVVKDEEGKRYNRYRCRRCNIDFTWNLPNNPWDMVKHLDKVNETFKMKMVLLPEGSEEREAVQKTIDSVTASVSGLQPVLETAENDKNIIEEKDQEMAKVIHEFKNYLSIELIKMDTWESRNKN